MNELASLSSKDQSLPDELVQLQAGERREKRRHIWFLNSAFDRIDLNIAFRRVTERWSAEPFAYVSTPNVDHLVRLRKDPHFAAVYAQSWLTICDSRVLELLARISDEPVNVATGADLTKRLFEEAILPETPITVIGTDEKCISYLKSHYGLKRVNWYQPPMGLRHKPEEIAKCAQFIADHPARYVFICVGSPQQEMVAAACVERGDCIGVGLCVGASLDFISGKAQRAPKWMQRHRLEWLHRLCTEPQRMWKRYLVDGPKVFWLYLEWRKARAKLMAFEAQIAKQFQLR